MSNETLFFVSSFNEQYSTFILVFFTVVLAIGTVGLALFTLMLFIETKKMRELQTDPKLSVYITSSKIEMILKNLIIENIGFGPAYNVKFQLSEDFTLRDGKKLSEIHMLKNGLSYIPPNEKFEFLLTNIDYLKICDECLTIKASYQNSGKKIFCDEFILDFSVWKNMETINVKNINDIVDELKRIGSILENFKK